MQTWVTLVALGSIALTALLTWVLWRINLGALGEPETRAPATAAADDADD